MNVVYIVTMKLPLGTRCLKCFKTYKSATNYVAYLKKTNNIIAYEIIKEFINE